MAVVEPARAAKEDAHDRRSTALARLALALAERCRREAGSRWSFEVEPPDEASSLLGDARPLDWPVFALSGEAEATWRYRVSFGGEGGIVVRVSAHQIDVRLYCVDWLGSHTPIAPGQLWRLVRVAGLEAEPLAELFEGAIEKRRRQFKRCRLCRTPIPPERLIDGHVCHGCSERRLGIVF